MQADISGSRVPMSTTYFSIFRGGGERCPLGLPFLMHSLPNQRDGSGTSVALRSVSGVLSFPNENRKSIIVKLDSN